MIEFQYPSARGRWFYAPQLRVLAAPGRTVSVLGLTFSIPGLADPIPMATQSKNSSCSTGIVHSKETIRHRERRTEDTLESVRWPEFGQFAPNVCDDAHRLFRGVPRLLARGVPTL